MKILIAEDEQDLRTLLRMTLTEEGYIVLEAAPQKGCSFFITLPKAC